jgi:hypothetical protein
MPLSATISDGLLLCLAGFWGYEMLKTKISKHPCGLRGGWKSSSICPVEVPNPEPSRNGAKGCDFEKYKSLYHRLQNLEAHPDVLPMAYNILVELFSSALLSGQDRPESIMACNGVYSEANLPTFLASHADNLSRDWKSYLKETSLRGSRRHLEDPNTAKK